MRLRVLAGSVSDRCRCRLPQESSTPGMHKVKLTGLMVTEEPESAPFNNWAAVDWINLAAAKDPDGVFEIKNIARRRLRAVQEEISRRVSRRYRQLLEQQQGQRQGAGLGEGEGRGVWRDPRGAVLGAGNGGWGAEEGLVGELGEGAGWGRGE